MGHQNAAFTLPRMGAKVLNMIKQSWFLRSLISSTGLGLAAGILILLVVYSPWRVQAQSNASDQETVEAFMRFQQAVDLVSRYYVEDVNAAELIDSAIEGMLSDLDPHSGFLPPKDLDALTQDVAGNFGGLGIQIDLFEDAVRIIAPIDNTPAFRAGLRAGDLIVALDQEPIFGKTLNEAVDIMRGEIGTSIELTIFRQATDERFDVVIERALIPETTVYSRVENNNVGYLRIASFSAERARNCQTPLQK